MFNVIILSDLHILNKTGAAFSRMREYSKGLSKIADVSVFLTSLLTKNNFNNPKEISTRCYITSEVSTIRKNFFFNRYFCFFRKKKELDLLIHHFNSENKNSVILVYNFFSNFWEEIFFLHSLKKNGFRVFVERNERSLGITWNAVAPKGFLLKLIFYILQIFESINSFIKDELVRFYDGVIVISTEFEKWISSRNKNSITIPILVSEDFFNKKNNGGEAGDIRIGYSGSINFKRDGLNILLEVMNILINNLNLNVHLTITGHGSKHIISKIKERVKGYNLGSKVSFLGYLRNEEVLGVLLKQDLFIVLRSTNMQGRFTFATKLAEYMAMGKLVMTTPVSDNPIYIKDNINGFLIEDLNPHAVAERINKILTMPQHSLISIKNKARDTALEHFNINKYSNQLFNFFFS